MSTTLRQNPDGSWSEAVPLGWQGPPNQIDWEVWSVGGRDGWAADGYNREKCVGTITARTKLGLILSARLNFGWKPMTFLWDPS